MFEKLHQALWKALTPDLVPDVTRPASSLLDSAVLGRWAGPRTLHPNRKSHLPACASKCAMPRNWPCTRSNYRMSCPWPMAWCMCS